MGCNPHTHTHKKNKDWSILWPKQSKYLKPRGSESAQTAFRLDSHNILEGVLAYISIVWVYSFHWVLSTLQLLASKSTTTKSKQWRKRKEGPLSLLKFNFQPPLQLMAHGTTHSHDNQTVRHTILAGKVLFCTQLAFSPISKHNSMCFLCHYA